MKVSLIRYTPAPEELCGEAAAICTAYDDYGRALRGALSSGHESVIEHATFTFRIEGVSRSLLAQITRHRIASFSVESQRYVAMTGPFPYVIPERIKELGDWAVKAFEAQMQTIAGWYDAWMNMLGKDGAEDARFVLPNACCTQFLVTMNARELMHFFELRTCNRAQWEIRALADEMLKQCVMAAPELFKRAGCACMQNKPCPEGKRSCGHPRALQEVLSGVEGGKR